MKESENLQPAHAGIYDARTLGRHKMFVLGLQHMFAMFGATILVPILTGLSVSATLLFAGLGTLLFHLVTKGLVPAFLGSSFAFLGGYAAVKTLGEGQGLTTQESLCYACAGIFVAGFVYVIFAALIKMFGVKRVMSYFPPLVTGPIIIAIGLVLSGSAIQNCEQNWFVAIVAVVILIVTNLYAPGFFRIVPILMGVVGSYAVAACIGIVDFAPVAEADWIGMPFKSEDTVLTVIQDFRPDFFLTVIVTTVPLALATVVEHVGDMCAIQSTVGKNYLENPGLHRTILGDGLATMLGLKP